MADVFDDDNVSYKLVVSEDRKKMSLDISSNGLITTQDYIVYLEVFICDLIRAQKQREATGSLH